MKHIPIIDMMAEGFRQDPKAFLEFGMKLTEGSSAFSCDRNRPYDGQPWTDNGIRGKTLVEGLTMRDIKDCFIKALLRCSPSELGLYEKVENNTWATSDLYGWNLDMVDPLAVGQNLTCEIEKMMGIFPNLVGCPPTDKLIKELTDPSPEGMIG